MRRRGLAWLAVMALGGCGGGSDRPPVPEAAPVVAPNGTVGTLLPSIDPSGVIAPAADPKLPGFDAWPFVFDARNHTIDGRTCAVVVEREGALVRELSATASADACVAAWDGRDASGAWLSPGVVTVRATVEDVSGGALAVAEATVEVVRLGIERIELDPVTPGDRSALLYSRMAGRSDGFYELASDRFSWRMGADAGDGAGAVVLELADGTPRELPAPWDDPLSPPLDAASPDGVERDTYNLPTAWSAGARLDVSATLSSDIAGVPGGGDPTTVEVRVVPPAGTEATADAGFAHGATVVVRTVASPVPAVGKIDWALEWSFEARRPGGEWVAVPGSLTTTHRLYGLVDTPIFDYSAVPHRAWVDVVDIVAGWVDGASADPGDVAGRIVEGVYWELGLRYDRVSGASFYTSYPSGWEGAVFDLTDFQVRGDGSTINCSDAGSIVSAYANMVGVDLRYHILQHGSASGFDLNYIQAIGWEGFTETPFTSGRGGFRYHAVVGPPDGSFFDATLALDGDGTPTSLPATLLLAQGMPADDYLRALSSEWTYITTRVDEKVRIR